MYFREYFFLGVLDEFQFYVCKYSFYVVVIRRVLLALYVYFPAMMSVYYISGISVFGFLCCCCQCNGIVFVFHVVNVCNSVADSCICACVYTNACACTFIFHSLQAKPLCGFIIQPPGLSPLDFIISPSGFLIQPSDLNPSGFYMLRLVASLALIALSLTSSEHCYAMSVVFSRTVA